MPSLAEKWYKQGQEEGIREGLYKAIELGLKLKFEGKGKTLFEKIKQIKDIEKLQQITNLIEKAGSLHEIEKALK